jgi:hypothetical protein
VTSEDLTPPEEAAYLAPLNIISVRLLIMMARWKGQDGTGRDGTGKFSIKIVVIEIMYLLSPSSPHIHIQFYLSLSN